MSLAVHNWHTPADAALDVHLLGVADFDACMHLQGRLATEVALRNDGKGYLLVCEHLPILTVGREGSREHIACPPDELLARELEVRWVNRGGGCVVHVPGQLAAYPILPLDRRGLGLADYRDRLEQATIDVCAEFRVAARGGAPLAGIATRGGQIAQIGVAVRSWVSSQGLFLNVSPAPDALRLVRTPTGRPTSLATECGLPVSIGTVRESLVRRLAERLGYTRFHLHTGHPLLRPVRRVLAYA